MIAARAKKPSRGMTVVAVLVCLIIVTLISGAVLKVERRPARAGSQPGAPASGRVARRVGSPAGHRPAGPRSRLRRRDVVAQRP